MSNADINHTEPQQYSEGMQDLFNRVQNLSILRKKFLDSQISKLPRATCSQDEYKKLPKTKCAECGGYHPATKTIHLDYVGHAALTNRLLDADPFWEWEPLAFTDQGLPRYDETGGLWIKLTVCGHTRLGYGAAASKSWSEVGTREKEVIGDALRNAAMRFGAALELWHKGELHIEDDDSASQPQPKKDLGKPNSGVKEVVESTNRYKDLKLVVEKIDELMAENQIEFAASLFDENCKNNEEKIYVADSILPENKPVLKTYLQEKQRRSRDAAQKNKAIENLRAASGLNKDVPQ